MGWRTLWLVCLLCWGEPSLAQRSRSVSPSSGERPIRPSSTPCAPYYTQQPNATYVAANHSTSNADPAAIGTYGQTTTIDAGLFYGGTVVFSGTYHVRGRVRLVNGTFELRPGTAFFVEGLSGLYLPTTPTDSLEKATCIEVENASLELTGATLLSTCGRAWGGVRLGEYGRIRTRANPNPWAGARRCLIQDAETGIQVLPPAVYGSSCTAEYYLNATDFVNNGTGLADQQTKVARAGTGVHYCSFSTDIATLKPPLTDYFATSQVFIGVQLWWWDQYMGVNNYAAASIDHSSFRQLDVGIYGTAQQLRISDNTFDDLWYCAIHLGWGGSGGGGHEGYFNFTPMYVEQNDIRLRGTNPRGQLTTWGIIGGVYARDNFIHGDAPNNAVEEVGIFMRLPDNSTQTRNTFEHLDKGIEVGNSIWGLNELDISGNMFLNVVKGISFFNEWLPIIDASRLHIRCNSFENPSDLTGAVALNIEGPDFPPALGSPTYGNGNRFVTPGLPFIEPITNSAQAFRYYAFASSEEDFSQASGANYSVGITGGDPAYACTDAGYPNGIRNRMPTRPLISAADLKSAYDSLRLATTSASRQQCLLTRLSTSSSERQDFAALEAYWGKLPISVNPVHARLGHWLLGCYRAAQQETAAQRVRTALLARHGTNPEITRYVQLSDALIQLRGMPQPFAQPAPAVVAALREVAGSGTAAARVACPVARRYAPACPCRFPKGSVQVLATDQAVRTSPNGLGTPYPNPTDGMVRVPYRLLPGHAPAHLDVRNALGQLLQHVVLPNASGEAQFFVGTLAAGLYTCTLVGEGQPCQTRRFAVTK